jgi:glycosyltransferase involved in cell wall biosynthesis
MKIAHVIPALTKGGAERVVVDLANAASDAGHEVTIILAVAAPPELMTSRLRSEIELVHIGTRSVRHSYRGLLPWLRQNRAWLFDLDIVHCHLTFGSVFGFLLARMRFFRHQSRPAIVETYHAVGMAIPNADRLVHSMLLKGRDAVAFMADDPYWRRYAARHSKSIIRTIPNGIDPPSPVSRTVSERYRKNQAAIPVRRRAVVGTVSRLARERRPELLLESFAIVAHAMGPDVHMLLAGEGAERSRLEAMAFERGISGQVHMPGLVLDPAEPISLMDLFVTVNVGPITGIAALEAAFLGVPVVAIQLVEGYRPAPRDWIWSSSDPAELARKMTELLGNAAGRSELASRQQSIARSRFSIDAMAQAYDELYSAALDRRERSS